MFNRLRHSFPVFRGPWFHQQGLTPHPRCLLLTSLFWLALALCCPVLAQTRLVEFFQPSGSTLSFKTLTERVPYAGCVSVVVEIRNASSRPAAFDLQFISSGQSGFGSGGRMTMATHHRIAAAAGKTQSQRFLIPLIPAVRSPRYDPDLIISQLTISYSGAATGAVSFNESYYSPSPNVLLSQSLYSPQDDAIEEQWRASHSGSTSRGQKAAAAFDPLDIADDWRTLLGYDIMTIRASEWQRLSAAQQQCVEQWVAQGGQLQILTPAPSSSSPGTSPIPPFRSAPLFGSVTPIALDSDGKMKLEPLIRSWSISSRNDNKVAPTRIEQLRRDFSLSWPLIRFFGQKPMHFQAIIIVLALFALLVGPVNVLWLARAGRRHRLFSTTPIFALVTSIVLFMMILFEDGIGGKGARLQWIQMKPGEVTSYHLIHQEQFSRTGVLLNRSFTLDNDTLLMPVPIPESRWAQLTSTSEASINLKCQLENSRWNLGHDWFSSRSEQAHVLIQYQPNRARIERLGSSTPITLRSTFDYELEHVFFRDDRQQLHYAAHLAPGQTLTLQPCSENDLSSQIEATRSLFSNRAQKQLEIALHTPQQVIAISQFAPGIATLPSINWLTTRTIITGPLHPSPAIGSQP